MVAACHCHNADAFARNRARVPRMMSVRFHRQKEHSSQPRKSFASDYDADIVVVDMLTVGAWHDDIKQELNADSTVNRLDISFIIA
jgi:hypothetical protein